jgi:hypothetical protein
VTTPISPDPHALRKGFQARVRKVLSDTQYKRPYGFTQGPRKSGFSHATLKAWLRTKAPRFPVTPALIEFAQLTGASLDYLILGEGPEFRSQVLPIGDLGAMLRTEIARRLTHGGFPAGVLIAHDLPDGAILLREITTVRYKEWSAAFRKRYLDDERATGPGRSPPSVAASEALKRTPSRGHAGQNPRG